MANSTVNVITGIVNPDGTVQFGSGFTSSQTSAGSYTIAFPSGTFSSGPVPVAMPISLSSVIFSDSEGLSDGSGSWQVTFADGSGNPVDTLFTFIIVG